jgi:hypothetical protein
MLILQSPIIRLRESVAECRQSRNRGNAYPADDANNPPIHRFSSSSESTAPVLMFDEETDAWPAKANASLAF